MLPFFDIVDTRRLPSTFDIEFERDEKNYEIRAKKRESLNTTSRKTG